MYEKMQHALEAARNLVEARGFEMVYFIVYDPTAAKFGAIAGSGLVNKQRLQELKEYAEKELAKP